MRWWILAAVLSVAQPAHAQAITPITNLTTGPAMPGALVPFRGALFFTAEYGHELWTWQPPAGPPARVDTRIVGRPFPLGDRLLFAGSSALFATEGTVASLVANLLPGTPQSFVQRTATEALFVAGDSLYKTDGRAAILVRAGDAQFSHPRDLISGSDDIYLIANDGTDDRVFRTDGVTLFPSDLRRPRSQTFFAGSLYVDADGLYKDGVLLTRSSQATAFCPLGSVLLFSASEAATGTELWRTDGTSEGTYRIKDIRPGVDGSSPSSILSLGSVALFTADDGVHGRELWRTDGTAEGTSMVLDIVPGILSGGPAVLTAIGDKAYFAASGGPLGVEPWLSDGTAEGTGILADVAPGWRDSAPSDFARVGDDLLFVAGGMQNEPELWKACLTCADTTPPIIVPVVDGFGGAAGVYGSDVTVSFRIFDVGSPVTSASCPGGTVTTDTAGQSFTCTATSAGGTHTTTLTVARDTVPPVLHCPPSVTVTGSKNRPYGADLQLSLMGVSAFGATYVTPDLTETKYYGVGTTHVSVYATDDALNSARCAIDVVVLRSPEAPPGDDGKPPPPPDGGSDPASIATPKSVATGAFDPSSCTCTAYGPRAPVRAPTALVALLLFVGASRRLRVTPRSRSRSRFQSSFARYHGRAHNRRL